MPHSPTTPPAPPLCQVSISAPADCSLLPSASAVAPVSGVAPQGGSLLTLDRIFGPAKEFKTEDWGPAYWLKDGSGYTTLEVSEKFADSEAATDAKDIVKYAAETGQRHIVVAAEDLVPPGRSAPLAIKDYAFSEGTNKVLIFTNTQRVWRHETRRD